MPAGPCAQLVEVPGPHQPRDPQLVQRPRELSKVAAGGKVEQRPSRRRDRDEVERAAVVGVQSGAAVHVDPGHPAALMCQNVRKRIARRKGAPELESVAMRKQRGRVRGEGRRGPAALGGQAPTPNCIDAPVHTVEEAGSAFAADRARGDAQRRKLPRLSDTMLAIAQREERISIVAGGTNHSHVHRSTTSVAKVAPGGKNHSQAPSLDTSV